jgi:hypothetical protein
MSERRKSMGKKLRFEVFKRDGFACQYCGRSAPEAILHVDHIIPVADGGGNDVTNHISACEACNLGKGATPLADDSVVSKQRAQMAQLQARREIIEMMAQWRRELDTMRESEIQHAEEYFLELSGCGLSESGRRSLRQHIRKFGFPETLEGISIACEQYIKRGADGTPNKGTIELAWNKVGGICYVRSQRQEAPWLSDFYRLRAACRDSFGYWKDHVGCPLLRDAFEAGHTYATLRNVLNESPSWSRWQDGMSALPDQGADR